MKKMMLFIMVIMGLPVAVNASNTGFDTSGFYIGIGHGIGTVLGPSTRGVVAPSPGAFVVPPGQQVKDNVNISEIHIGYDVNPFLSFELGYADYGSASKTFDVDYYSYPEGEKRKGDRSRKYDINVFSLATLIKYPIYDNLSVYGLASYDKVNVEAQFQIYRHDPKEFHNLAYGAGLRWAFSENFAAKLQWKKTSTMRVIRERINLSNTMLIFEMSL